MDWLLTIAAVLWLIVILGTLYAAGYLRPVSRWPIIGSALNWLIGNPIQPSPPVYSHTLEECRQIAATNINLLQGVDGALQELDRWRVGFRANRPGVVFWLVGPRGTGKSTLASTLGCYFRGYGAIQSDKACKFFWHDLQQNGLSRLNDLAEESLDGILLLDGADWLIDENLAGIQAGAALRYIAETYYHRLTIVVTCRAETWNQLNNNPHHRERWLDYFTQHVIEFPPLSNDALLKLIYSQLPLERCEETDRDLTRLLRAVRYVRGGNQDREDFSNAFTAKKIAEYVINQCSHNQLAPAQISPDQLQEIANSALGHLSP